MVKKKKMKVAFAAFAGVMFFGSQMQALGVDIQTIQSIVGHADTEMTEHYRTRLYDQALVGNG